MLESLSKLNRANLVKLLSHLIYTKAISIAVLRVCWNLKPVTILGEIQFPLRSVFHVSTQAYLVLASWCGITLWVVHLLGILNFSCIDLLNEAF